MKWLLKIGAPYFTGWGLAKYVILGILSGLFGFLFISSVTSVIGMIIAGNFTTISKEYILIFISIILLFVWIRRTLSLAIVKLSQTLFWNLRKHILSLVLNANYQQLSGRKPQIRTAVLNDIYALTDTSLNIIQFTTSAILALSCLVYLFTISWVLFLITLFIALVGVAVYHLSARSTQDQFKRSRDLENGFQESLGSILDGFKEIYIEPKKGKFIYDHNIRNIADKSYANNMAAFTGFINNQITGQVLFYVLISAVLLFFSLFLNIKPGDTVSFIFTLLYLLSSIETIMVLLPGIARAKVAADHLSDLTKELAEADFNSRIPSKYITRDEFEQLTVQDLEYHYVGEDNPFAIGPINFELRKGEIVFIYGGNGSGKTTFLHSVLGLRIPSSGGIMLNDALVTADNYTYYKTLFSVVFSDFYLFHELVGIDSPDMEKWDYYIRLFELEGKVTIENNRLSTTDLSAGQRKRLALIAALMEDKPVLVMDEWAADQDPYFRKKFYTQVLPILKKEGITIIAITHDDKYYSCADKLYKMDYGKLIPESIDVYEPYTLS